MAWILLGIHTILVKTEHAALHDRFFFSLPNDSGEFTLLVNQVNNLAKEQVILPSSGHILVKWCNGAHCVHILVSTESQSTGDKRLEKAPLPLAGKGHTELLSAVPSLTV